MDLQAIPVKVERGVVRSVDGTPLPEHANALLVIMPDPLDSEDLAEWQRPFDKFFEQAGQSRGSNNLEQVSDTDLNQLVHSARRQ
jgi:hypothetical protein